jgi:Sec-independent protein translocase protein TatA
LASELDVTIDRLPNAASELADEIKELKKQLSSGETERARKEDESDSEKRHPGFRLSGSRQKIRETWPS